MYITIHGDSLKIMFCIFIVLDVLLFIIVLSTDHCKRYSNANLYQHIPKFKNFLTLIFTNIQKNSKCKLRISRSIYLKRFSWKCLHIELYWESTKKFANNNTKIIYKIIPHVSFLYGTHNVTTWRTTPVFNKVFNYFQIFWLILYGKAYYSSFWT